MVVKKVCTALLVDVSPTMHKHLASVGDNLSRIVQNKVRKWKKKQPQQQIPLSVYATTLSLTKSLSSSYAASSCRSCTARLTSSRSCCAGRTVRPTILSSLSFSILTFRSKGAPPPLPTVTHSLTQLRVLLSCSCRDEQRAAHGGRGERGGRRGGGVRGGVPAHRRAGAHGVLNAGLRGRRRGAGLHGGAGTS
jgi:hypothetical protein